MLPAHQRSPRFQVSVSKKTIDAAKPGDAAHCMIARGLRDAYPSARWVLVDLQSIRFTDRDKGFRYIYMTPRSVQRRLIDFEQGTKPAPFAFLLAEGHARAIFKKPAKAASAKLLKAGAKGRNAIKERLKHKSVALPPHREDIPTSHKRQFGIRAL